MRDTAAGPVSADSVHTPRRALLRAPGLFNRSTVTTGTSSSVYAVAFTVYDMTARSRQIRAAAALASLDLAAGLVFGPILGWI